MKVVALLLIVATGAYALTSTSKLEAKLTQTLRSKGTANILVSFQGTAHALNSVRNQRFSTRGAKANSIFNALQVNAKASQARVLAFLESKSLEGVQSFWISNQIYVKNASRAIVQALAAFQEVTAIREEGFATIDMPTNSSPARTFNDELTWGLIKIQAPEVWELEGGNTGEGVVVGGIDTGVRRTHEALRDNFRGEYGWFDPSTGTDEPTDNNGHGTHTMGTIAGSHYVGVAPGATWMACRGCATSSCSYADLLACGEFMLCPTLANGEGRNCSMAPKIVSNSWGGSGGDDFYYSTIQAWYDAEMVPVFANGNRYPWTPVCGSVGSPADFHLAIGVGNTDSNDALADSSCQGPTLDDRIKPEVSAPGTNVLSSTHSSDTSYDSYTGTSMATPHVAGVAALLASRNPDLTVEELKTFLTTGNEQDGLLRPGNNCGGISETEYPNNAFGHGRISALNSFNALVAAKP